MLKEKELAVFNFIRNRLSEGISPSVREIMDFCENASGRHPGWYTADFACPGSIGSVG